MRGSPPIIREAVTAADYAAFADLCRRYVDWCRARYASLPWFVDAVFGHQSLEAELAELSVKYGPPHGRTLLAVDAEGRAVAAGAFRRSSADACELKRLYVSDEARGLGLGRTLTLALMELARADGYRHMQLDTADRLTEAIALYRSMGFEDVPPYLDYPAELMPHLVFMRREL